MAGTLSNGALQTTIENFMVELFAHYHKAYIWGQANFFVYGYSYNGLKRKYSQVKGSGEGVFLNPALGSEIPDTIGGGSFFERAKLLADSDQVARVYTWYYYKKFITGQLGAHIYGVGRKRIALHLYTMNRVRVLNGLGISKDEIKSFMGIQTDSSYYFNLNAVIDTYDSDLEWAEHLFP